MIKLIMMISAWMFDILFFLGVEGTFLKKKEGVGRGGWGGGGVVEKREDDL